MKRKVLLRQATLTEKELQMRIIPLLRGNVYDTLGTKFTEPKRKPTQSFVHFACSLKCFFNESLVNNLELHHAMPRPGSASIPNSLRFSVNTASIKFNNVSFSVNTNLNSLV